MTLTCWAGQVEAHIHPEKKICHVECDPSLIKDVCGWISGLGFIFATIIVEENPFEWLFRYIFYSEHGDQVHVFCFTNKSEPTIPSISSVIHAADWQEREIEDLFGLNFEGHPRLGDFVLHEQWPEGINPMRKDFYPWAAYSQKAKRPKWQPQSILKASGAFMMPIGPVYSDAAESAHFLLETIGEDVVRTIPRFFYKYRGIEKIAEGHTIRRALLIAERFSGTSAFAHSLAFCSAVEQICGVAVPERAKSIRIILAELERLRHHVAAITGICTSTSLAVAAAQTAILEEDLLRLTCVLTGHRYIFGMNIPGGVSKDLSDQACRTLSSKVEKIVQKLMELGEMLRFTSSFLDRLEEVGTVSREQALAYGLVGPIARASGVSRDLRRAMPYAGYEKIPFEIPGEQEGDGYARLRLLFNEALQSSGIIKTVSASVLDGPLFSDFQTKPGTALGWVEAPRGAAFHWVRINGEGLIDRYRLTTPSFSNWHGFHLAAEDFAFQDFPIIMATFGLSNSESDR